MKIRWFSLPRILGLVLVLIYHLFPTVLPGGFVGVDVFFAFSGYLITALMIEQVRKNGKFEYIKFMQRRVSRLLPPLLFMLLCTVPLTSLISPDFLVDLNKQMAAVIGWITNYYEISTGGSYEAQLLPHLYVHTWSIAVEMHFYIIWGLIAAIVVYLTRRMKIKQDDQVTVVRISLTQLSLAIALLSYLNMRALTDGAADASAGYMGTLSHSLPLMFGAAAGALFGITIPDKAKSFARRSSVRAVSVITLAISIAGLCTLSVFLDFSAPETFIFGLPSAAVLAIIMILSIRVLHESTKKDEPKTLEFISNISYSVFLFHWPLFIIAGQLIPWGALAVGIMTIIAATILSVISYYYVELGFAGKINFGTKKRQLAVAFAATVMLVNLVVVSIAVLNIAPYKSSIETTFVVGYLQNDAELLQDIGTAPLNNNPLRRGVDFDEDTDQNQQSVMHGIIMIGDSVLNGAGPGLRDAVPAAFSQFSRSDVRIDARGYRTINQGQEIVDELTHSGTLREYVVIALGTRGYPETERRMDELAANMEPGHRLIFVTPYNGKPAQKYDDITAEFIRTLPSQYPYVTVADWAAAIEPKSELLSVDLVHLNERHEAIKIYCDTIIEAILIASQKAAS